MAGGPTVLTQTPEGQGGYSPMTPQLYGPVLVPEPPRVTREPATCSLQVKVLRGLSYEHVFIY